MVGRSRQSLFFSKAKRRLAKYLPLVRMGIVILALAVFAFGLYLLVPPTLRLIRNLARGPAIVFSLFSRTPGNLASIDGRTNILLLGAGGAGHEGIDLTDTVIFISTDLATADTLMLSLPRDIWVPSMRAKINTAYHYGQERRSGGGLILAKAAVSEILDQPVHYAILVDFDGWDGRRTFSSFKKYDGKRQA